MTFNFSFRAGYFTSVDDKWEIPHVLEHLMFNGNKHYKSSQEFNVELEKNGAYANAYTNNWNVAYESECANFESMRILELVLQSLTSPLFLQHEFDAEIGNVQEELQGYLNSYFRVLNVGMLERSGMLALNDQARISQLANITRADMFDHHQKTHTQKNLRFVIAGQTDNHESEIIKLLESYSAQLPEGEFFDLPAETPKPSKGPLVMRRQDVEKLHYYFDLYIPDRRLTKQEDEVVGIVERLLTKSMTSKIFGEARRRGLAYGMSSSMSYGADDSRWWFGGSVNYANASELFELMFKELDLLSQGKIAKQEVETAKLQALGSFMRSSQRVSDLARGYENTFYFDETIEDYNAIPDQIKAVTKTDVVDLANSFISRKEWDLGLLGKVDSDLSQDLYRTCRTLFD